ncbi:MAG: hypothetical protein WB627_06870, partial [Candidatus Acidiferrum sp.]
VTAAMAIWGRTNLAKGLALAAAPRSLRAGRKALQTRKQTKTSHWASYLRADTGTFRWRREN